MGRRWLAVLSGALVFSACAGAGSEEDTPDVPVVTLSPVTAGAPGPTSQTPDSSQFKELVAGPMEPGDYATSYFVPGFTFTVDEQDSFISYGDEPKECPSDLCRLGFEWIGDGYDDVYYPLLTFFNVDSLRDPQQPFSDDPPNLIPLPEDPFTFISGLKHLDVIDEGELMVGGQPARYFDAIIVSAPQDSPVEDPSEGARWYVTESAWLPVGEQIRWMFLDLEGKMLQIWMETHQDDFDRFVPIVERLMTTLRIAES